MSGECRLDVNSMKAQKEINQTSSSRQESQKAPMNNPTKLQIQIRSDQYDKPKDILGVSEDNELLSELEAKQIDESNPRSPDMPLAKIQKAPEIMQQNENFKKYFKPRELSIGPIHAHSGNLLKKELKVKLTARFVKNSGKSAGHFLCQMKSSINKLKGYFCEEAIYSFDDDSLARLLFLDGCSVLQFIYSYLSDDLKDFRINNGQAALIQQDLLLVENQIPFLVLKVLMDSCDPLICKVLRHNLIKFVLTNVPLGQMSYSHDLYDLLDEEERVHLLELLRAVLIFGDKYEEKEDGNGIKKISMLSKYCPQWQSKLCFPCFRAKKRTLHHSNTAILRKTSRDGEPYTGIKRSFRNVQELKMAGINLRPSSSCSLRGVSFTTRCFISGQLELPALVVDSSTAPKLLNLVAYEMGLRNYRWNCAVTSYVNLLDLLIDGEKDVRDLRGAHILRNRLSSDAEVAQLFNSIGYNCLTAPRDTYLSVKDEIQRHYERQCAIWMAQVYHDRFSSPWTILALLATVIALLLTAIQTWYAAHPKEKN